MSSSKTIWRTFVGESTQNVGRSFTKSYCVVHLEGVDILLAWIIVDVAAITQVWSYIGQLTFNMLVLVGTVEMSDRTIRK